MLLPVAGGDKLPVTYRAYLGCPLLCSMHWWKGVEPLAQAHALFCMVQRVVYGNAMPYFETLAHVCLPCVWVIIYQATMLPDMLCDALS